ncbi:hypothetical protein Nit79A3_2043 [Nitrosomonas sp. Is79A3]|uniref:hypothetical protein n=1 Tax=Nitrosomonas sp. (strain Is79A3) TaxID=261292 RepID=UPI000215D01B
MKLTTHQSPVLPEALASHQYPQIELVTRSAVTTQEAAYYLSRRPQTLRAWSCLQNGPLRPIHLNGRLAWKVADIKALLSGDAA